MKLTEAISAIVLALCLVPQANSEKVKSSPKELISQLVEQYGKAVVMIATVDSAADTIGLGNGFIVTSNGVIVTNLHVVRNACPAIIKLTNGDIYDDISVVDIDPLSDIVIIKIEACNLPTVKLGDSDNVKVGQQVVVIGNAQGSENSVSDGLLSGIRDREQGYKIHEISPPISPGSSGSPVLNLDGEVMGIATATIPEVENSNFSIPINYVKGMISDVSWWNICELKGIEASAITDSVSIDKDSLEVGELLRKLNELTHTFFLLKDKCDISLYESLRHGFEPAGFRGLWNPKYGMQYYWFNATVGVSQNDQRHRLSFDYIIHEIQGISSNSLKATYLVETCRTGFSEALNGIEDIMYGLNFVDGSRLDKGATELDTAAVKILSIRDSLISIVNEYCPYLRDSLVWAYRFNQPQMKPTDPYLGILFPLSTDKPIIVAVRPHTPAREKLEPGDLLLGAEKGPQFSTVVDFYQYMQSKRPGEKVVLIVNRESKEKKVKIKVGSRP